MIKTTIFPGRYVQGKDARKKLSQELSRYGAKGLLICDSFVYEKILPDFEPYMQDGIQVVVEKFDGESSDEEINRLLLAVHQAQAHFIVGLGGGKAIDTAKAVAHGAKLPVVIVPTLAASDAPCSAVSVIYTPEGEFKRYLLMPQNPNLVLMDTQIVTNAPIRFLIAGMGDALATWFEAESCMRKYAPNMTGDLGSMSAYSLAKLCYDTLMEYGLAAKTACINHVVTPALERIVEANTLLSGIGFESAGLAAAHAIHNGMTALEQTHPYFHGEKVAFGTLASLFLTDKPTAIIDEVYSFCETIGLPTTLAELGLGEVSDQALMKVATASCKPGETMHNEPTPVNPDMVFSALKAADAEGKSRRSILASRC
ncbi:MAG: glycerol dehydrogenase [Microcoleaceae cyanobacterium]